MVTPLGPDDVFNASTSNISLQVDLQTDDRPLLAVMGMLAFFSVIGTAGNAMVLYVYVRKRHKLAATVFIISLAATDFMTCVVIVPYTIAVEYLNYQVTYDAACKMYMFFITSNVPFAAFIMVAIAFDRYLCICHPFMHLMNAKRAKIIILNLAFLAFTLGVITSLNYGVYTLETKDLCAVNNSVNVVIATTQVSSSFQYVPYDASLNTSKSKKSCPAIVATYTGECQPNEIIFSNSFVNNYQKVYTAFFLLALCAVMVLYGMVYRSVLVRRAKRRRQRRSTRSVSLPRDSWFSENRPTTGSTKHNQEKKEKRARQGALRGSKNSNGPGTCNANGCTTDAPPPTERGPDVELVRQLTIRERGLVANIRTAAMLFVVTAMFVIAFLPAWLMAHQVVEYNMIVFYMYFIYNVANPIIYAFMNKAFRRDLRDVFDCKAILRDFN